MEREERKCGERGEERWRERREKMEKEVRKYGERGEDGRIGEGGWREGR